MIQNNNRARRNISPKKLSVDITYFLKYFALVVGVVTIIQSRIQFSCSEDCFGVFGGGTRLAMPKTICTPDTSSFKPGSGATEGVLDYGVPGHPGCVI